MREKYSQPILLVQRFKVSDNMMASSAQCGYYWCQPNGDPVDGCPLTCGEDHAYLPKDRQGKDWTWVSQ